jgi:hypothetical protein
MSMLAVGSPERVAVLQRLVELQKTLNILYVERRHLIDDKSKGMLRFVIYFHHDYYVFCECVADDSKGMIAHDSIPSIYA